MKSIVTLIFFLSSLIGLGQDYNFLESKNGFREIKLGTSVANYPEFKRKDNSNAELFKLSLNSKADYVYVGSNDDKIKTAKILFIYLTTNNNIISEIKVVTEKVLNVYAILNSAYGEPSSKQGNKWIWKTNNLECSIEGDQNTIPGYHIVYKDISNEHKELKEMKLNLTKKAQSEL
jgi:hypothetical protein